MPDDRKPGSHDSIDDGTYRGVDPSQPMRLRDQKKNRRVLPQRSSYDTDWDPHDTSGE